MTHRKLRVPASRRRASGHAWQSARKRSTRDCGAEVCQACGLVRMMSYRTGRIVGYEEDGNSIRNAPRQEHHEDGAPFSSDANELPSVALTPRFLALCRQYGSEQLAVSVVAAGRSTGVPGLPQGNDSTAWNADHMRATVEHLERKLGM